MPAPFAADLCGYRAGKPNTSDSSKPESVELGNCLFEKIGVEEGKESVKIDHIWSHSMRDDLKEKLTATAPHLVVDRERAADDFEQYAHLNALKQLTADDSLEISAALERLQSHLSLEHGQWDAEGAQLVQELSQAVERSNARRRPLLDLLGDESLPRLDIAVHRPSMPEAHSDIPHLVAGLSLKWSLRTDRLQDPRTHGAKMAALRRGRMPHFAAVTMEPRPYFLARLGQGTGDLDCVYHLHLPALVSAVDDFYTGNRSRMKLRDVFHRMVDQRRIRDYDDLVEYLGTL
ncbi:NgoMIV family type II restriction endonuclease [Streptomyces niger]|uniref:NgoMIV family type II restriction endonuclease n=1 Tax=Streptomyces niger TaxID=66373 RepID=UPI000DA61B92|nr:NgoMIV family type II restriction endonuclease [Streptomyces niger]